MISKREAERLVDSFLDEARPLNLPESFAFRVRHRCGGAAPHGCQGVFSPARYNSSRAKCIRCSTCQAFFSPNKVLSKKNMRWECIVNDTSIDKIFKK